MTQQFGRIFGPQRKLLGTPVIVPTFKVYLFTFYPNSRESPVAHSQVYEMPNSLNPGFK